jgi:hypothetical protein
MGVDARMVAVPPRPLTAEALRQTSYIFGQGAGWALMVGYGTGEKATPLGAPLHPLEREEWDEWGLALPDGTLEVPLGGRYYGEGYERGPLLDYIGMAELLEVLIPGVTLYYGGDSGSDLGSFDRARRHELLAHFAKAGHAPYHDGFNRLGAPRPTCPVCQMPATQFGYGAAYAMFRCLACDWGHEQKDGVVTTGWGVKS